jgi:esterase/lipase superfamily enzyme
VSRRDPGAGPAVRAGAAAGRRPARGIDSVARSRLLLLFGILLAALLAGCQTSPVRLMPTPVPFVDGYIDPFRTAGADIGSTEVPVFYVTNRAALIEKPEPIHLTLPADTLRMGVAHLRIGDGTLDWETLHRLSTSAEPEERPIVSLERLEQMAALGAGQRVEDSEDARAFFDRVNRALAASPHSELLVYVHGSNNTVPRAAAQASQFRHFTGRRMVVLVFMWPSAGSLLRYLTDVVNAAATVDEFARLIALLAEHTDASSIDVLAYSAGAQVASPALAKLGTPGPGESRAQLRQRLRLGQVYFAAPDIDTRRFVDEMKAYVDLTGRISLAMNLNDSALRLAAVIARASRAGRPDLGELGDERSAFLVDASNDLGFDVINVDPNDIPDLPVRSHAFWYDHPWVSGDLLAKFLLNAAPDERGLEAQATGSGKRYWRFPADYDRRLADIIRTGIARLRTPVDK